MIIEDSPRKSVFQITLTWKPTDRVLLSTQVIAYSESEAIEKVKVGSIINEFGLKREDVDFYIRASGILYEGDTFAAALAKTPELTTDEKTKCAEIKPSLKAK